MNHLKNQTLKGFLLGFVGVLFISPDTLLLKLVDADLIQMIFWKNLSISFYLLFLILFFEKQNLFTFLRKRGWTGILIGICYALGNFFFVLAVKYNPAANVLVILCISPLFTGIFSYLLLKEKLEKDTLIALVFCMLGISILLWNELDQFNSIVRSLFIVPALIILPFQLVMIRKSSLDKLYLCMIYGSVFSAIIAFFLMESGTSTKDIAFLSINGIFVSGIAFSLILSAPKYISATWTNLFLPLETVIGTYLVWLFIGEKIGWNTLLGSGVVITVMTLYFYRKIKAEKQL